MTFYHLALWFLVLFCPAAIVASLTVPCRRTDVLFAFFCGYIFHCSILDLMDMRRKERRQQPTPHT